MKISLLLLVGWPYFAIEAQDLPANSTLTLKHAFDLAIANSFQLKANRRNVQAAQQEKQIALLDRLPVLGSNLTYGYISNADVWDASLSHHQTALIPHHATTVSAEASETVFNGGEIKNRIRRTDLQVQLERLSLETDIEDIKLLVAAKYLDIYRLTSEQHVYENNIISTETRLRNVLSMQGQGMVTQNDVLRNRLILSDLHLSLRTITDDILILNKELNIVIGRPDSVVLVADSALLPTHLPDLPLATYLTLAHENNPGAKSSEVERLIAETNLKLVGGDRLPQLYLYGQSNFQRPFASTIPAIDIYTNVWQAGIGLHYNISSIYQTNKKLRLGKIQVSQSEEKDTLVQQYLDVAVRSGFIKFREANQDLLTLTADLAAAEENYRVVETKYFNQLALLTDMIDAVNTKIESELKVTTAKINVIYRYCQLLRAVGTL
jgi:outer membrane protein